MKVLLYVIFPINSNYNFNILKKTTFSLYYGTIYIKSNMYYFKQITIK